MVKVVMTTGYRGKVIFYVRASFGVIENNGERLGVGDGTSLVTEVT